MAESFESARSLILSAVNALPTETVPLLELVGRVLADDIRAPWDLPRWDNSAMDGFAVRAADCVDQKPLSVDGYIPAGGIAEGVQVRPGCAVRIMTGAPTPQGCDAVVPIEETEEIDGQLIVKGPVKVADHIRLRGEDVPQGAIAIAAGKALRPAEINMLAAFGFVAVPVVRRPRVAILSTGDELVQPGEAVGPGQIINSNAFSLAAAVREAGGEPLMLGIARDERDSLQEKLREGLQADVLITSAGVSMGDRDLVCEMLEESGVEQLFWKVDIKPGRPTAFGLKDGKPVFSLPGNPVSTMVTFEELVRPALLKMLGHKRAVKPFLRARLTETIKKKAGRVLFLRVIVEDDGERLLARSSGDQNTGILSTMVRANGIAILPAELARVEAGALINIHMIADLNECIA